MRGEDAAAVEHEVTRSGVERVPPANLRVGSLQTNLNFFAGQIDEVRLYDVALTAAQVAALP